MAFFFFFTTYLLSALSLPQKAFIKYSPLDLKAPFPIPKECFPYLIQESLFSLFFPHAIKSGWLGDKSALS